jgi:hypothetical protein
LNVKKEWAADRYRMECVNVEHWKWPVYRYNVFTLRDLAASGLPAPSPVIAFLTPMQFVASKPKAGKQEIGTWKTSRHKTFRTRS